jgi:hypothetical protein
MEKKFVMVHTTTTNVREKVSPKLVLWKALVGASQRSGTSFLGDVDGGYVNVVAAATDISEFEKKVKLALGELGLDIIEIDEVETLPMILSQAHVSKEVLNMAKTVRRLGSVAFGTFYVFTDDKQSKDELRG